MKGKLIRKIFIIASYILCGILVVGTIIANENATAISSALGQDTYKLVQPEDEAIEDSLYYTSEFSSYSEALSYGREQAYNVVAEGSVLLKNENDALPLDSGNKITLFGAGAYDPVYGGTGSGGISTSDAVSFVESLEGAGLKVNPTLAEAYQSAGWSQYKRSSSGSFGTTELNINEAPWDVISSTAGNTFSEYSDAAILIISRVGGEGYDLIGVSGDGIDNNDGLGKDYLGLNQNELDILQNLTRLKENNVFKKVIVILNYSSMIEAEPLLDDGVDAVLWVGAVGMGNAATGDILTGVVNPSGRLSDTMWVDNAMNPVNVNFKASIYNDADTYNVSTQVGTGIYPESTLASYVVYQEGMYLGYRYTETRYEDSVLGTANVGDYVYDDVVAYPFGYGLSYTTFSYKDLTIEKTADEEYTVSVTVTNTGDVAGKVSVPVWISKPYNDYAKTNGIQVPSVELLDFGKTDILDSGESQTLTITVDEKLFSVYDSNGAERYVLLGGDYYIAVGGDSHEAINNVLAAKEENGVSIDESKMVRGTGDKHYGKMFRDII